MKLATLVAVIAFATPAHAEPQAQAPSSKLEDVVISLVMQHCLPETLAGKVMAPSGIPRGEQDAKVASQHDLSPSALKAPTTSGLVYYDHYAGYCRVLALPADGQAITDRLIQNFVIGHRSHSTWRYPDHRRTLIDHTSFDLDRQRRGHCVPVVVIDFAARGSRWIDINVGWGSDSDGQRPEMCGQP
ncbi:MAG: hypothetical protein JSR45_06410 [Proteobacteria bacterium]|nr:hypothetical protein [Pseudomonadota bacterium]